MFSLARWSLLALPVALAACSNKPAEVAAPRQVLPVYAVDLTGGAKLCTTPDIVAVKPGETAEAAITIGNDGGWCAIRVAQEGPKPFDFGLVARADRPAHGRLNVHAVGDYTRLTYTPDPGYVGPDAFLVELRPGAAKVKVAVTVQGMAQPAVAPAAAAPPAAAPAQQQRRR